MDTKSYTQVLIDEKVYTLGDSEDESHPQKAASYVSEKNGAMREVPGFIERSADYQMVMTELNITSDHLKAMERGEGMKRQKNDMEKEVYSLKRELVSMQMELEAVLKGSEERQRELDRLNRRTTQLKGGLKEARENLQNLGINSPAETESRARIQVETVEGIEETVEIEAGITWSASRPGPVFGSAVREASQSETVSQTLDADASARRSAASADQSGEKWPAPSLRVLALVSEADKGMVATSTRAATTAAPFMAPSATPVMAPPTGGMTNGELAKKALRAAGKTGSHKDGRR